MSNTQKEHCLKLYNINKEALLSRFMYYKDRKIAMSNMRHFVDNLCNTFHKKTLSESLNGFQCELLVILGEDKMRSISLGDKDTIPLYFINLFLKDLNMTLEED